MVRIGSPGPYKARSVAPKKYSNNYNTNSIVRRYYNNQIQTGYGSPDFFRASSLQRGHGLGDVIKTAFKFGKPLLKNIFNAAKPTIKKGARKLGASAIKTGAQIAGDLIQGRNFKDSAKKRTGREFEKLKRQSINTIQKVLRPPLSPKKRKTRVKKPARKINKRVRSKKNRSDNFGTY